MKICFICNEYPPAVHGGIGSVTKDLAEQLVASGHTVNVVGLHGNNQTITENIKGVFVHRLSDNLKGRFSEIKRKLRIAKYIAYLANTGHIDLIEAPEWRGDSAMISNKLPVVIKMHKSHIVEAHYKNTRPQISIRLFENIALLRARHFCAVSNFIVDENYSHLSSLKLFRKGKPVEIIYNGIDADYFMPFGNERKDNSLLFAGTIKKVKGIDSLMHAFNMIAQNRDIVLHIAGQDTLTDNKTSYLQSVLQNVLPSNREKIIYHGLLKRDELRKLYSEATVSIFPSLVEAFPTVVLEAMSCESPVILGNCGPHSEIITHNKNGLICDSSDPEDIAEKILSVLKNRSFRDHLGTNARQTICKKFNYTDWIRRNIEIYAKILENK
jgi:glycosyltransferase involved in cell wall biosynthesis